MMNAHDLYEILDRKLFEAFGFYIVRSVEWDHKGIWIILQHPIGEIPANELKLYMNDSFDLHTIFNMELKETFLDKITDSGLFT